MRSLHSIPTISIIALLCRTEVGIFMIDFILSRLKIEVDRSLSYYSHVFVMVCDVRIWCSFELMISIAINGSSIDAY
jgi:hypothetical protein